MSATLSLKDLYVRWKPASGNLRVIVSSIQKNNNFVANASIPKTFSLQQMRRAPPLKIYRKEIAALAPYECALRPSVKIADLDMPGSSVVSSKTASTNGLALVAAPKFTTLGEERPTTCTSCVSAINNAKRRVRSSGMVKRAFNLNNNNDRYATSTQEYLTSRNRTIKQNEYVYLRQGNSGLEPGTGLSKSNIYSPAGLSHCYQPMISAANANNSFQYVWLDGNQYTVTIPDGMYSVESLNAVLQTAFIANKHYFIYNSTSAKIYLLQFAYDTTTNTVVLKTETDAINKYNNVSYSKPSGYSWTGWPTNTIATTSFIISTLNGFQYIVGFIPGTYTGASSYSNFKPAIAPNYVALYYKPNNPQFGVQGAVDSSTRLMRKKYNTINDAAAAVASIFGNAAADALAYGVSETPYTSKTKMGYNKPNCTLPGFKSIYCPRRIVRG